MTPLHDIVARLSLGSHGKTEAEIQADVRAFLLTAPLDLVADQVVDVALEAQVPGGGRIDVAAGCAVIEVKKSLAATRAFEAALTQLAGYVAERTAEHGQRYVGVLTDGRRWILLHLQPNGCLSEVSRLEVEGGGDAARLAAWLETVLATTHKIRPTPKEIVRRLGAQSPAAQLDLADLRSLYADCRWNPEVQLKRELWARLLLSALGTTFEDSDELFVTHTYLVLSAELIAHEVMGMPIDPAGDVRALLEGQQFDLAGLHGVIEADFFDWPATVPSGTPIVRGIARRLGQFAWTEVEHDVLKVLYESIIDAQTRKRMGEYYTPDWLAQKIVNEEFTAPLEQRLLDPACGSGTFLFWAIRRAIDACEDEGMDDGRTLEHVVSHVAGMDLHPVAVTLARVTYLLALTPERIRRAERDELTVPVFLGDSLRWEQDNTLVSEDGLTVHTSSELELFEQDLHFPEGVVEEPERFDRLVAALATKAASRRSRGIPKIGGLMNKHKVEEPQDRAAVELVFTKLCRLHDAGRDHLWSYYIRNLARPLAFTGAGRVDVVIGNPPWLAFRHMPPTLQETYRELADDRGLWVGGKTATHQDLSDLFVARAVEQYLNVGGRFSFVMPYAALSRFQYAGFRTGSWPSTEAGPTAVAFESPEDFATVKPPLFAVPSCVVKGAKATAAVALESQTVRWSGRVPGHHISWAEAANHLTPGATSAELASDGNGSPYRARFRQGATLVPRVLLKVVEQPSGPLGGPVNLVRVASARSSVEKEPWKSVRPLSGRVERTFVRPTHLGATIVAFRCRDPELAVIPWHNGRLLDGEDEALDEFEGLADWWRKAERIWERRKAASNALSLRGRIDFQRGVSSQFPVASQRVAYTRSGQYLAACRIDDPEVLIEQTLYWTAADSVDEAHYLCAILNSGALADAVAPLQSRGQHNPRDFAMSLFAIPFPAFDARDDVHETLARLGASAERVVAEVELDDKWQFQKARRLVREALREHGVLNAIDAAVGELLAEERDVLDVFSAATGRREPARRRERDKLTKAQRERLGLPSAG